MPGNRFQQRNHPTLLWFAGLRDVCAASTLSLLALKKGESEALNELGANSTRSSPSARGSPSARERRSPAELDRAAAPAEDPLLNA